MPAIDVNGVRLHHEVRGSGDVTVVMSHGFLMNHRMFAAQVEALAPHFRVVTYDHRCHGDSQVVTQPFGMQDLTDDAAAFVEAVADGPVHFVGMSTGGFVALRLMIQRPDLLRKVVLIDTSASAESPEALRQYGLLLGVVRWIGLWPVVGRALKILMGERFRTLPQHRQAFQGWVASIKALNAAGLYAFGKAIFGREEVLSKLGTYDKPVLVLVGEEDVPTPVAKAKAMADALPAATLQVLPASGHTSPVEVPDQVSEALLAFLCEDA